LTELIIVLAALKAGMMIEKWLGWIFILARLSWLLSASS
jgi:hypothetical protein